MQRQSRQGHTTVHPQGVAGRSDVALSPRGEAAVDALAKQVPRRWSGAYAPVWFTSPLERTRHTASILREALPDRSGSDIEVDARLVELDFGIWEGSTWEAVHRDYGEELASWSDDWVNRSPPEGETFSAQASRCRAWLAECFDGERFKAKGESSNSAVVVSHGGSIRALICHLLDQPLEQAMRFKVDPATVYRFDSDDRVRSGWRLTGANLGDFGS